MKDNEGMQSKQPEKKDGGFLSEIFTGVALTIIAIIIAIVITVINGPGGKGEAGGGPKERPRPTTTTWGGKARDRQEVFERIKARLVKELEDMGIDPSNVLVNAKEHPASLVRPVPEHPGLLGRVRLLVLSDEDEAKIARSFVESCRKRKLLADAEDPAGLARVERIVKRLVPVIREIGQDPEVHLLRDDSVNACCLPDGTVLVNTGTLKRIPDDGMLAAILAHELGHAAARHGNEGISRALKNLAAGVAVEEWLANASPSFDSDEGVSLVRILYGIGSDVVYMKPRDRRMEAEADRLGVRYLARAGYDPEAMARLFEWFERIAPEDKESFFQVFRSHPFHSERAEHVREVLKEPDFGQPLPPTLNERFGNWENKAADIATNIPSSVSGIATNLVSSAASLKTNVLLRIPRFPKGENP